MKTYSCGLNDNGQLGQGDTIALKGTFSENKFFSIFSILVSDIFVGYDHAIWKTNDGIYSSGYNDDGACGIGNFTSPICTPTIVKFPKKDIVFIRKLGEITAGNSFTIYLCSNGEIYKTGKINSEKRNSNPKKMGIKWDGKVIKHAAGYKHYIRTLCLISCGKIFAIGEGDYGQLGIGKGNGNAYGISCNEFVEICLFNQRSTVKDIKCGVFHSYILLNNGFLFAFGYNFGGQVGNGSSENVFNPIKVASNVECVIAGARHGYFFKYDGNLYVLGSNGVGQLGMGDEKRRRVGTLNGKLNVDFVYAVSVSLLQKKVFEKIWNKNFLDLIIKC